MPSLSIFNLNTLAQDMQIPPNSRLKLPMHFSFIFSTTYLFVLSFSEWLTNQHRDSYASYIGHHSLLSYIAIAENAACGRLKFEFLEKMNRPCGVPPVTDE